MKPLLICLMGPTASGKTELAVALARHLPVDIISVDSAMVYRGMDIGTAKPDAATLAQAPHRLIDLCDPAEPYSAARFRSDALAAIGEIQARGKIPLLVGGTMLYFRALLEGLSPLPPANAAIRQRLVAEAQAQGWAALHRRLQEVDPDAAARIHRNDPQRLQRALEVYELTGQPLSRLQRRTGPALAERFTIRKLVLLPEDRALLHGRIARRFHQMLAAGLLEEVQGLFARSDLHPGLPSIKSVGYRQVWQYLAGHIGYDEMVERGIIATRQLAKRQLTWLRAEQNTLPLVAGGSPLSEVIALLNAKV